ncbi:MAG: B12-binding domain-containing radical SAM protein [Candidatus Hydrogenedentes bacterium]|nr:B12-binding domain-containing radical SAM protein [Candidatus Hydrogenedentota bacterium]
MKVTFVYPDVLECVPSYKGAYYVGIAYLSAVLRQAGHTTSLIHIYQPDYNGQWFRRDLDEHQPDLIAFSSVKNGGPMVQRLASFLEESKITTPTIYGGIHPTLAKEECVQYEGIDMICVGEGEEVILDVVKALEHGESCDEIPNLWIKKKDGRVIQNPLRQLVANLDTLPFPDRDLFDYPNMHNEKRGEVTVLASRGCPYGCTYCANRALMSTYKGTGKFVRFRSPENVAAEINLARQQYPFIHRVHFDDDILFMKKDWGHHFVEVYSKDVGLPFCSNIFPRLVDEEVVEMLAKSGCDELRIGLESGNERIRKDVLKRELDEETIVNAFQRAKKYGIHTMSFNMMGLPYEDAAALLDTIKLNAKAGVDNIQHTIFHPYPGTPLADLVVKEGWVTDRVNTSYYQDSVLNLPTLSRAQLHMFQRYFHTLVGVYAWIYRRPKWLSRPIERALDFTMTRKYTPAVMPLVRPLIHAVRVCLSPLLKVLRSRAWRKRYATEPGAAHY